MEACRTPDYLYDYIDSSSDNQHGSCRTSSRSKTKNLEKVVRYDRFKKRIDVTVEKKTVS